MSPRVLMRASALVLCTLGLVGTFLPDSVLTRAGAPATPALMLLVQTLGALYLGFAGLNWMARDNLIGGIYGRPVAVGNLLHFLTAGLAAIKLVPQAEEVPWVWPFAVIYSIFAVSFALVLFRHPVSASHE
jgi:hypothetical protein